MTIFDSTTDKCENCGHPQKAHDYETHDLGECPTTAPATDPKHEPVAYRHRLVGTENWHLSAHKEMKSARDYQALFPISIEIEPLYPASTIEALKEENADLLSKVLHIVDSEEELVGTPSPAAVAAMIAVGPVENARTAVRVTKASIARRISAHFSGKSQPPPR